MTVRRRFYKDVTVTGEFGIALDGKVVKTPLKAPLRLPNRALAEVVAAEWAEQGEKIEPQSMYCTRIASTAIDRVVRQRGPVEQEVLAYANSDLVCYRAEGPELLCLRQSAHWDPVIAWSHEALKAAFATRQGVMHRNQPPAALDAVHRAISGLDDFTLAATHAVTMNTGSALIALMLALRAIDHEKAWNAANVDEDYQWDMWGKDMAAAVSRVFRYSEYDACREMLEALHG